MNMKTLSYILPVLNLIVGCTPTIVDRDFEKEEREYIKKYGEPAAKDPLYAAPTDKVVFAGEEDGIRITLARGADDKLSTEGGLQNWYAVAYNSNKEPKCFAVSWKLMDFELITDNITFVYLKPNETKYDYARFKQKVWDLDGISLVLPPSGYIDGILVKDPTEKGDCEFITETIEKD